MDRHFMDMHIMDLHVNRHIGERSIVDRPILDHGDWRQLCKAAMNEPDPDRLMELVSEINILLDPKRARQTTGQADGAE